MPIDPKTYYDTHQADERSVFEDIEAGMRIDPIQACQYFIKGLAGLCTHWDDIENLCKYVETIAEDQGIETSEVSPPSGYNGGKCNYLGRRHSCNKYECKITTNEDTGQEECNEDLDKYWCIAPNMFLSGLAHRTDAGTGAPSLTPIAKSEIPGYCEGRCDEQGRGTGCEGTPGSTPIICNYYRPFQMGFGADEPHQLTYKYVNGVKVITEKDIQDAYDAAGDPLGSRLPFSFKLYNMRAYMQKCAYWDSSYGSRFKIDTTAPGVNIKLDIDTTPLEMCTSTEAAAQPYVTYATEAPGGITAWLLKDVWSEKNTVICNGAKPECPCYTGKWNYVTDEKMLEGMRITALQALELRFWTSDWGSATEYERFFKTEMPNFQDPARSDIYTYTSMIRGATPADSIMKGNRYTMCVPATINEREFSTDYVTIKPHTYPKLGKDPGTTVPKKEQVYYPNLIRDPDVASSYIRPLNVVYPYYSTIPFPDRCVDRKTPLCVKRGCLIENDSITVIGSTVRRSEVYVLNTFMFTDEMYTHISELANNWNVYTISDTRKSTGSNDLYDGFSAREQFFMRIPDFIDECKRNNSDFVVEGAADDDGVFNLGPIPIIYQQKNMITIFVKFSDGTWDFRHRPVWLQWYGGAVVQKSFTNEPESGGLDGLPNYFEGSDITGSMVAFSAPPYIETDPSLVCSTGELIPFGASYESYNSYMELIRGYGYCIKKITVADQFIETWGRIGNAGLVWVDIIEDLNINHIFEWDIDTATMVFAEPETSDDEEIEAIPTCRDSNEVEMEVQAVETFVSGNLSIPPTARILKPKDTTKKFGFFNSDAVLKVTYWYKTFSNTDSVGVNEEITYPNFEGDMTSFIPYGYTFEQNGSEFSISNLRWDTVALMGYFNDEQGRLISCVATKMLVQVVTVDCRNVDIRYNYSAPAIGYRLMPETSMSSLAVVREAPIQMEISPFGYQPPCGDHEGPWVWFPFNSCGESDFYQEYAGGAFCTAVFPDTPRDDMRLCVPSLYKAWVSAGSASAYADCVLSFHYRYGEGKQPSECLWAGAGRIVYYVNLLTYIVESWTFPPFGNKGREFVERYLSSDYHHHLTYKGVLSPSPTTKYVPIVPDNSDFYFSFNVFDQEGATGLDPFSYVSQINFFKSDLINEKIQSDDRLDWDGVFNERVMTQTTYPQPLIVVGTTQKAVHYNFIDAETTWAWRELWKGIEIVDEKQLYFVRYEKPDYKYGVEKDEHRYICDENEYTIYYKAPVIEAHELLTYPSLKLGDNGKERWFEIRYDSYNSDYIDWNDEDSGGVGGSGDDDGEGQGNIYERTSGSEWNHDVNILFNNNAVDKTTEAEDAGRKIQVSDDTYYYNRGIIANIKKDALIHLPYGEDEVMEDIEITTSETSPDYIEESEVVKLLVPNDIDRVWYDESFSVTYDDIYDVSEEGGCISKVEIVGKWGVYTPNQPESVGGLSVFIYEIKEILGDNDESHFVEKTGNKRVVRYPICKPGITIRRISAEGEEILSESSEVEYDVKLYPKLGYAGFKLEFSLEVNVDRMFYKPDTSLIIDFNCVENQFIFLGETSITLYIARYTETNDKIDVYERKYVRSKGSNFGSVNINGPAQLGEVSKPLQRELQDDNSGSYFGVSPHMDYGYKGIIQARDKLRGFYGLEQKTENEALDIEMTTLTTIESTEQMLLYESAIQQDHDGDTWNYSLICPPALTEFLRNYEIPGTALINGSVKFVSKKYKWQDHYLSKTYEDLEGKSFWQPLGHVFKWGDKVVKMRCYEFVPSGGAIDYTTVLRVYDVFEVVYKHLDTDIEEVPSDPYTALYANRIIYQSQVIVNLTGAEPIIESGPYGVATTFKDKDTVV